MRTLSNLLKQIRSVYKDTELRFVHPTLYLLCVDSDVESLNEDQRLTSLATRIGIDRLELDQTISSAGLIVAVVTPPERKAEYSFLDDAPQSHHWIEFLANNDALPSTEPRIPVIHFYGFKGGQARSTILSMTAQSLANDGYRVLVVDADLEAPSLQAVFDTTATKLESTVFGCVRFALSAEPQAVLVPKRGAGRVDLVACRPTEKEYDLDFANFALRTALDPSVLERFFSSLLQTACGKYDLVLLDHRTGLSASVIPLVAHFPGPVIVCLRLDEQSDKAENYFDVLFRMYPKNPGCFVSFSLHPEESYDEMLHKHRHKIESLLEGISSSLDRTYGSTDVPPDTSFAAYEPDDLIGRWLKWYHDPNFLIKHFPPVGEILTLNQKTLNAIRDILGLSATKVTTANSSRGNAISTGVTLTGSGSTDAGPLIEADALRNLRVPSTPYTYIFGRKGTGKTRLLRTLVDENKGLPMLVAEDSQQQSGIRASDTILSDMAAVFRTEPVKLWWALLDAALTGNNRDVQQSRLREILDSTREKGETTFSISPIRDRIAASEKRSTLLIDGVETAFSFEYTSAFIEGLFRFLSAIQTDTQVSQRLTIRLFIRTDLAEGARENIEQQIENRVLRLAWDTQSILNFVLARIASIEWFRNAFPAGGGGDKQSSVGAFRGNLK